MSHCAGISSRTRSHPRKSSEERCRTARFGRWGCLSIPSSWGFAARRTSASAVCAVQQLIGAAVMNNTFGLGIFMGLIYFQDLYWK